MLYSKLLYDVNAPSPRFRPFNFKKIPPREKEKACLPAAGRERRNGARADTELVEVWSDLESPRNRSVRIGLKSPRTRSVRLVRVLLEKGSRKGYD